MEILDFYDPTTVEDYDFVAPTTVEDIFQDYRGRRSGLLVALTTGADSLCFLCSGGINNMCLYGLPNGKWQVRHPRNELDLPQPVHGIKYVDNGIEHRQKWLTLIAKQSDSWLLSLSFYFASHLSCNERNLLFNLINNLPTLSNVVTGEETDDDPEMSIVVYKAGESRMQEDWLYSHIEDLQFFARRMKYSISVVADKGLEKHLFTSARLKKGAVLYLETHSHRYELCFAGEKTIRASQASQQQSSQNGDKTDSDTTIIDVFRWSRCKKPLPQKRMQSIGFPLPLEHVEVLEENLDWEDIQWSETGVWIAEKEYKLARVHFMSPN